VRGNKTGERDAAGDDANGLEEDQSTQLLIPQQYVAGNRERQQMSDCNDSDRPARDGDDQARAVAAWVRRTARRPPART
jgi:hypothetical protein